MPFTEKVAKYLLYNLIWTAAISSLPRVICWTLSPEPVFGVILWKRHVTFPLLTFFRTGVQCLPPLLLYILLLCDWRYVFKPKWISWFRSNVYVSYIGELGEYFSDSKPIVAWPRGLFIAVSTGYTEMTNRRDHTFQLPSKLWLTLNVRFLKFKWDPGRMDWTSYVTNIK